MESAQPIAVSPTAMGRHNLALALSTVWEQQQISRADLARRIQVSKPAVSRIVNDLIRAGFLAEAGIQPAARRGRPASMLEVRGDEHYFFGIELRLDRLTIQARDFRGRLLDEVPAGRPDVADADVVMASLLQALVDLRSRIGRDPSGVGVAVGAQVDQLDGMIVRSHYTQWRDVRVTERIREALSLPDLPVGILDVARCGALANWREVAADPSVTDLLHLQIGIGAGAGMVTRSDPNHVRFPGPIAHLPLDRSGPRCACGATGCLDAVAGFHALVDLSSRAGIELSTSPDAMNDYCVQLENAATSGNRVAQQAIEEVGGWIGQAAAGLILSVTPTRFTLAGYPALLGERFQASFTEAAKPHVPWLDSIMVRTELGDNASAVGAYLLAVRTLLADPLARSLV